VYTTLERLEGKGFVRSRVGEPNFTPHARAVGVGA
jgi:hypothetical protein